MYSLVLTTAEHRFFRMALIFAPAKANSPATIRAELEIEKLHFGSTTEGKDALLVPKQVLEERREIDTPVKMSYYVDMLLALLGVKASDKAAVAGYQTYLKYFTEAASTGQAVTSHDGQEIRPDMVIGKRVNLVCRAGTKPSKGGLLFPFKNWSPA